MAECCLAIKSKGDMAILPLPVGVYKGERNIYIRAWVLSSRVRYMRNFISLAGVER